MASNAVQTPRISRPKKLEKPRPLNINVQNRHSVADTRLGTIEEIMVLADTVVSNLANENFFDRNLRTNIKNLHSVLKVYGSRLEAIYKDQLDRSFANFRNGSRDDRLDYESRLLLLELIELRATQWSQPDHSYYKFKLAHDADAATTPLLDNSFAHSPGYVPFSPSSVGPVVQPQPLILGPGELVKSSGKYAAPTRVIGKNYCKDEVVIRNSDSGKVMGIKGRRVHMIEELSETVISFQRVNPGAKERLVQITGPNEEKITYAKQLMEDTIRRNASPVRCEGDPDRPESASSVNTDSDENVMPFAARSALLHSFSTNDASLGEYKYTVTVGGESIRITGINLDLVRTAKLVLDEYFSPDLNEELAADFGDSNDIFDHIDPDPYSGPQDEVTSKDTEAGDEPDQKSPSLKNSASQITGVIYYSAEKIIKLADSPLSRQTPENWDIISHEYPAIIRKPPIEWLTAAIISSLRPQDGIMTPVKTDPESLSTILNP